jgi:hypothetical protein
MKLTPKQREALALESISGLCIEYRYRWIAEGQNLTVPVATLIKRGLMRASYYRGGTAEARITDTGRAALASAS